MKLKNSIIICSMLIIVLLILSLNLCFDLKHVVINDLTYSIDIKDLHVHLNTVNIKELNKCTKLEKLDLTEANENSISKLKDFHNLNDLTISFSEMSSLDSEKISHFDNLKNLAIYITTIDFKKFNSSTISQITLGGNKITNFKSLSRCHALYSLAIEHSTISDNCIISENNKYVMKDSSVFASFDSVEKLNIFVDKIEDISGILEMESLKEFKVDKMTLSEDDKKSLEDKGISIIYYDKKE